MGYEEIIQRIAISALPILIAITFHEVAHGFVAWKLGDPTAKMMGRLTLNPFAHIDLWGTVLMPIVLLVMTNGQFMFGYAKPVPINPSYFKNPRRDMALSAVAGPAINFILAAACIVLLKVALITTPEIDGPAAMIFTPLLIMLKTGVIMNVVFAAFNLLPIPPLDGGRVLMGLLPWRQASMLEKIEPYGFFIVLALVATGLSNYFVGPLINALLATLRFLL